MNLRRVLVLSTNLMICTSLMSSFVHAEDYITKLAINASNGVAGLNDSKQVTADVNNNNVNTNFIQLNQRNDRLRFITNSPDTNNNVMDMFYNRDAGNKDDFGNLLDPETFYFTNNRYGRNFRFKGTVKADTFFANTLSGNGIQLPIHGNRLRFTTNSPDTNNNVVDIFYNRDAGNKDDLGNELDSNTFYFTNNRYGNNYKFNGNVTAKGMSINGYQIDTPIPGGVESVDPYNTDAKNANLIFLSKAGYDWGNVKPNTLMIGGGTRNAVVGIKATCQNTGQGDQGGSCYQFTNMSGGQYYHRGGAGGADGINMDMRTMDNAPMDTVGGNTLIKNSDGSYVVKGNKYKPITAVDAGATKFSIKGIFGCGIGDGLAHCEMTGANFINSNGKNVNSVKVTPGKYDPVTETTEVNIASGYSLKDALSMNSELEIVYYSADGNAYGIGFGEDANGSQYAAIYPSLSEKERNLTHARMAVWSNMTNGMAEVEGSNNEDAGSVDMPNYYYGYADGFPDTVLNQANIDGINADKIKTKEEKDLAIRQNKVTKIYMRSFSYPGLSGDLVQWKISKDPIHNHLGLKSPGFNENDQIDNSLVYACPTKNQLNDAKDLQNKLHIPSRADCFDKANIQAVVKADQLNAIQYKYNTNYHYYQKPALFLGLIQKNFNLYTQQSFYGTPDSITREFDNEWDFPMYQDHGGQVQIHGLTMVFSGGNYPLANGSYMLRMAGFNHMPIGLKLDGIWPYGGKNIETDAGFFLFKWAFLGASPYLQNVNDIMSMSGLGQAKTNQGSYQLMTYMSNDGNIDNKQNNSLHFGLTKQNSTDPLQNLAGNQSPTCDGDKKCSILGQVIFDPLGYSGGIALGSGQGEKAKLGLIVDKDSNVIINNKLILNGKLVNDLINKTIVQSAINASNGVAGLNDSKQVTADVNNNNISTNFIQLNQKNDRLRFITNSPDTNNNVVDIFYNRDAGNKDDLGNELDSNTLYFTNNRYGNNYKFNGSVKARDMTTDNMVVNTMMTSTKFVGVLATPSSSIAPCTAGEFKDDTNYHYVCVATNKWKRVALSDF